ncbi:MAG: tail fiber domain-containing protein [Bacteroidota bacterium]
MKFFQTLAIFLAGMIFPWTVFAQGVGTPGGTIQFPTVNAALGGGFAPLAHVQTLPFGTVTDPASIWAAIGQAPFPGPSGDFPYGLRLQKNLSLGVFNLVNEGGAENLVIGFGENEENAIRFRYISDQLGGTFDDPLTITGNGFNRTGRVGVGTTNPNKARMDVFASGTTTSGAQGIALYVQKDGSGALFDYGALIERSGGTIGYGTFSRTTNAANNFAFVGESKDATGAGYGIYATADNRNTTGAGYGVFGNALNSTTQYGVFGNAVSGPASYAGYFNGRLVYTGSFGMVSDRRLKKDIKDLNSALAIVSQLRPTTYTYRTDEFVGMNLEDDLQYGFIAQEVQDVLPSVTMDIRQPIMKDNDPTNMTYEDFVGMDYVQLIPILTAAIQELEAKVAKLEKEKAASVNSAPTFGTEFEEATLYQNQPNPFSEVTTIRYQLPRSFAQASLYVYDMQGKQVRQYDNLNERNSLEIQGSDLQAGMYLYSLVVDGAEIDTKRMILTK